MAEWDEALCPAANSAAGPDQAVPQMPEDLCKPFQSLRGIAAFHFSGTTKPRRSSEFVSSPTPMAARF
jgi:hypothetical protein